MKKETFENAWIDFKLKCPIQIREGRVSLSEENLRMCAMGFYMAGKANAMENIVDKLKGKLS